MKFWDYIFFRVCWYYKKKKDSTAEFTACLVVSLLQYMLLFNIIFIAIYHLFWHFGRVSKYWGLVVLLPLGIYSYYRYVKPRKYREYRLIWKDEEPKKQKRNGWLIVAFIVLSFVPVLIHGFLITFGVIPKP